MNTTLNSAVIERLVEDGFLSSGQVTALQISQPALRSGKLKSLLATGVVPEQAFASTVSLVQGIGLLHAGQFPVKAVPGTEGLANFLVEHEALPVDRLGNQLRVAMTDPCDGFIVKVLQNKLGCEVEPRIAVRSEILSALDRLYQTGENAQPSQHDALISDDLPKDLENDSALVRDLHRLIQRAVILGASD
ncbi:MAG: hypothetical protein HKN85_11840, partial [Gammaproteobacteria bacterium]|nr:hypothetical protein [Gammaproteobacteria bacterium]